MKRDAARLGLPERGISQPLRRVLHSLWLQPLGRHILSNAELEHDAGMALVRECMMTSTALTPL